MNHSIKCVVCNTVKKVNGQRQISQFAGEHNHNDEIARITGRNIVLDNKDDRITLKLDRKPLYYYRLRQS